MTIEIGNIGRNNLERWGYCVGFNTETGDLVILKFEGANIGSKDNNGPDAVISKKSFEDVEWDGDTAVITEDDLDA